MHFTISLFPIQTTTQVPGREARGSDSGKGLRGKLPDLRLGAARGSLP